MTKNELKKLISEEMKVYGISEKNLSEKRFRNQKNYMLWQALKRLRIYEYYCSKRDNCSNSLLAHLIAIKVKVSDRRLNIACSKVGVEFSPNMIGKNIRLCHNNIVLFGSVGENCVFHGNNVVGNKRTGSKEIPRIGNNVDVGFGAIIIGDIEIADGCVIGAGAVVTKSCTTSGSVLVGVPARKAEG